MSSPAEPRLSPTCTLLMRMQYLKGTLVEKPVSIIVTHEGKDFNLASVSRPQEGFVYTAKLTRNIEQKGRYDEIHDIFTGTLVTTHFVGGQPSMTLPQDIEVRERDPESFEVVISGEPATRIILSTSKNDGAI